MQISLRTCLLFTLYVSMHFALRQWWITSQIPRSGGLIPVALAGFVAIWIGAAKRSALLAGALASLTAVVSESLLAAETVAESSGTDFLRSDPIDAQYNTDIELNRIAVMIVGALSLTGGCGLGFLSKLTADGRQSDMSTGTICGEQGDESKSPSQAISQ